MRFENPDGLMQELLSLFGMASGRAWRPRQNTIHCVPSYLKSIPKAFFWSGLLCLESKGTASPNTLQHNGGNQTTMLKPELSLFRAVSEEAHHLLFGAG